MPFAKRADQERVDIHTAITNKIVEAIEANPGDWKMPWHRVAGSVARPTNIASKKAYQGVNVLSLWCASDARGWASGVFGTYRQWREQGAQVRKGERGSFVVFYKQFEKEAEQSEKKPGGFMMARASTVFAAEQVEGYQPPSLPDRPLFERLDAAEAFFAATGARVRYGGTMACYRRSADDICMPDRRSFVGSASSTPQESFYSMLAHETGHWTGAGHRLNREFGKRFGDNAYAVEELVAETTAAFLCADLGISNEPREDHAQYLSHWLKVMKADNKAIFVAAAQASKACAYLHSLQPERPESLPAGEIRQHTLE